MILFKWFRSLIERILSFVKKLLPYIMIGLAIYFSMGALLPAAWPIIGGLGGTSGALGALGLSFLFAPEETASVISSAAGGIADAAGSVISAAGEVAGSVSSALLSGLGPWLIVGGLGLTAYFLLTRKKEDQPSQSNQGKAAPDGLAQ